MCGAVSFNIEANHELQKRPRSTQVDNMSTMKCSVMRSGIESLKRNCKNSHQQPLPGSLGKTGLAKADVNIPLSQ
jgi:hypothetical protein